MITEKYTADFSEDVQKTQRCLHSNIDEKNSREVWKQIKTIEQKFISSKSSASKERKGKLR